MTKILLVEDDLNLGEIYKARLEAEGFQVLVAKDGEEGLMVAKANQPDLLISDVMMPRVSGMEMLEIIKSSANLKNMKVIMLTALNQNTDEERAKDLGADKYLVKSQVTLEDIVTAVHELLSESSAAAPAPEMPTTDMSAAPEMPTMETPSSPMPTEMSAAPTENSYEAPTSTPINIQSAEEFTPPAPEMPTMETPSSPMPTEMSAAPTENSYEAPTSTPINIQSAEEFTPPAPEMPTMETPSSPMPTEMSAAPEIPTTDMSAAPTDQEEVLPNYSNQSVPMNDMSARSAPMPSYRIPTNVINDINPPTPPSPSV